MERTVLFVCEHGAAKSVVAAAWLNRLADEARIPLRGLSRGKTPSPVHAPEALAGLLSDGMVPEDPAPVLFDQAEVVQVWRVVTCGPELADIMPAHVEIERWSVPAVGDGYEAARDALLPQLRTLIQDGAQAQERSPESNPAVENPTRWSERSS